MKAKLVLLSLGAIVLVVVALFASQPVRPPERSHIAGAWCGYTDSSEFLRMELDDDSTGFLCVTFVHGVPPRLYRITNWKYSDWKLEVATQPIDADAESVILTNIVCAYRSMECEFGGTAGWKRKAELFSEREWSARVQPLRERIAGYRKDKR